MELAIIIFLGENGLHARFIVYINCVCFIKEFRYGYFSFHCSSSFE